MRTGDLSRVLSIDLLRATKRGPMVVAHRGCSGKSPENTLAAFKMACDLGADMIECDVRLTKDGQVVAFHDRTLDRTTNGKGRIESRSLEELKRLDAGSWFHARFAGERIPTLSEVLELLKDRAFLNIELKANDRERHSLALLRQQVLRVVKAHRAESRVFLGSFNHRLMREIKAENPRVTTAIIYKAMRDFPFRPSWLVARARADAFVCGRWWLSDRFLKDLRAHNIPVFVYTVNTVKDVQSMVRASVDGIITNFPDLVVKELVRLSVRSLF